MAVNPAVIGGGVLVAAAAIGGGVYASGALSSDNKQTNGGGGDTNTRAETPWTTLSSDTGYLVGEQTKTVATAYKDKYGDAYGRFLVGQAEGNKAWWEEAFTHYKNNETKAEGKFKGVNGGTTGSKALKTVCDEAYKEDNTGSGKIKAEKTGISDDQFLEDNIWEFCSPIKTKIKSITDEGKTPDPEYTTKTDLGNDDAVKKSLVSVSSKSESNKWFWKWIDSELKNDARNTLLNQKQSVLEWCTAAYKASSLDTSNVTKANIFKWCSLTGREPASA